MAKERKELTANEKKGLGNEPQKQLTPRKPNRAKEVKDGNNIRKTTTREN